MSTSGEASSLPVYTWDEIEKHKSAESLWVVIDGNVYDVTAFQEEHPGGEEVLLENAGTDATGAFTDVGHSQDAIELQKKYLIGVVGSNTTPTPDATPTGSDDDAECARRFARMKEVAKKVVPYVLVAGVAIGLGIYFYKRFK